MSPGQHASGTVEFQTLSKGGCSSGRLLAQRIFSPFLLPTTTAEKALATVRGLRLTINPPGSPEEPTTHSKPRLVKQLPPTSDDQYVYDLFRPFGPIARAHCILTNPAGHHTGFRGMANVEYYSEEDAQRAQNEMHCLDIEGKTISVSIDNVARRPEFSAQAAPFVPGAAKLSAQAPAFSPPSMHNSPTAANSSAGSIYASTPPPDQLNSSKGPIWAVPNSNLQYSTAAATYIDPCNLFCKNLCPSLASGDLFNIFKPFGRIVSARVMRDEHGTSREFGFVSFTSPDDAARALHAINGQQIGTKTIMVRLHEPKKMRQEKLNKIFSGDGSPSPGGQSPLLGAAGSSSPAADSGAGNGNGDYVSHGGGSSDSIYATNGNGAGAGAGASTHVFSESQLSNLAPDVRSEVLNTEFTRRVREVPAVSRDGQVKDVVHGLLSLSLSEQVKSLNETSEFAERVQDIRERLPVSSPTPAAAGAAGGLAVPSSSTAESASMLSSAPASSKERARLLKAVSELMPSGSPVEDVTDLLAGLSKKDRAMALFNPSFLRAKVEEAKEILDITADDGDDVAGEPASVKAVKDAPVVKEVEEVEKTAATPTHTLSSLAQLPCSEIISLVQASSTSKSSPGLPLPKTDPSVWSKTDSMMDRILAEPKEAERKQKLGDVLFKKIKAFGIKGAPKVTIALLDSEDLRALAHVMDSYPELLKEKVGVVLAKQQK